MRKGFLQAKSTAPVSTQSQPSASAAASSEQVSAGLTQLARADAASQPTAHSSSSELQRPPAPSPEAAEAALQQCLELLRSSVDEKK
jgi:hypothetical protein